MTEENTKVKLSKKPPKNRLIWGVIVFVFGFLCPLLIPLVVASGLSAGLKTIISGLLAFGIPELFMIIAAGILGKEGFGYVKRWIRVVFKRYGPPDTVSLRRYRVGLIMFFIPIVIGLVLPYLYGYVPFILNNYLIIAIGGDILLVLSLFILGGDFWDKLRGLFSRNARIQFLP